MNINKENKTIDKKINKINKYKNKIKKLQGKGVVDLGEKLDNILSFNTQMPLDYIRGYGILPPLSFTHMTKHLSKKIAGSGNKIAHLGNFLLGLILYPTAILTDMVLLLPQFIYNFTLLPIYHTIRNAIIKLKINNYEKKIAKLQNEYDSKFQHETKLSKETEKVVELPAVEIKLSSEEQAKLQLDKPLTGKIKGLEQAPIDRRLDNRTVHDKYSYNNKINYWHDDDF